MVTRWPSACTWSGPGGALQEGGGGGGVGRGRQVDSGPDADVSKFLYSSLNLFFVRPRTWSRGVGVSVGGQTGQGDTTGAFPRGCSFCFVGGFRWRCVRAWEGGSMGCECLGEERGEDGSGGKRRQRKRR